MSPSASERPDWERLFARRTAGVRLGLDAVRHTFDALGRPCADVPAVHLVGTNGKGSTASMVAHGLAQCRPSLRVGLYTSPHLHRVGERVVVDGAPADEHALWEAVVTVDDAERAAPGPRPLSFFEVLTLAALVTFARAGVQRLVVEAGLGGRLDATRVVAADVIAVTSIAADHQQWLGDDLADIAGEKAGVFVPGIPVFSAPQAATVRTALRAAAERVGCPLTFVSPLPDAVRGLAGSHQRTNAAVALAALRVPCPEATAAALDGVHWPARLETVVVGRGVVTLDAAHNPAACQAIADALHGRDGQGPAAPVDRIVAAAQADKDQAAMRRALSSLGAPLQWVDLEDADAWRPVVAAAAAGEHVLVCGSHRLVAMVRARVLAGPDTPVTSPDPSDPRHRGGTT